MNNKPKFRNPHSAFRISSPPRRGILLLVVLGLLTLFLFIGTAFVISSNQFRLANRSYQQAGNQENISTTQHNFLDEVLNQLVRDTNNQNSVLRYHSLLRDLYGTQEGIIATVQPGTAVFAGVTPPGPGNVTNGQFIELKFQKNSYFYLFGNQYPQVGGPPYPAIENLQPLPVADNAWNGRLLTFLDGQAACRTARIVGYINDPSSNSILLRVENFPAANGSLISDPSILNGTRFVVNGRPFNGTGVGYDQTATSGDPRLGFSEQVVISSGNLNVPMALAPNASFFNGQQLVFDGRERYFSSQWANLTPSQQQNLVNGIGFDGLGGSDESYDAPDFQNMFLAWSPPSPQQTVLQNLADPDPPTLGSMVLPSFHRPALLNFWARHGDFLGTPSDPLSMSRLGVDPANASLLRKILLRPNWFDHPNFTGSNPYMPTGNTATDNANKLRRMIYGPWDVDNDKDGTPDSVWVDFGAPIIAGPDGKLVKPLAAILVLDMDGRLNVNAHGTRELAGLGAGLEALPSYSPAGLPDWDDVSRGQGFGPADITFDSDTNDNRQVISDDAFRRLLNGGTIFGQDWPGRYGTNREPGNNNVYDLSAQLKMQGFPSHARDPNPPFNFTLRLNRSNFGTLPDLRARYKTALNDFGQFVTTWTPQDSLEHALDEDNPYELNLSSTGPRGTGTSVDNPFSLTELERLLRAYDIDSPTLPPRLYELLKGNSTTASIGDLNNWRTLLTTDSYDLPEPGFQMPEWVINGGGVLSGFFATMGRPPVNATFADLIEYRLRAAQNMPHTNGVLSPTDQQTIRQQVNMLVAPEMLAGLKLDLNRPFGNGRDDNNNNNGVVDEPGEDEGEYWLIDENRAGITASQPTMDFENPAYTAYRDAYDRNGDGTIDDATEQNLNQPTDLAGRVNLHNYRRQLLARHLYVLAWAVVDPIPTNADGTLPAESKIKVRQLAQWAINAVDFRDPDNIMTAFEYDENPFFNGWVVDRTANPKVPIDGIIDTSYPTTNHVQLVWGTERPELVMTETLAWHDRRTEDGKGENPDSSELDSGKIGSVDDDRDSYDRSYDQRERPIGAAFIELYNPWSPAPGANEDTHFVDNGNDLGVNLAAVDQLTGNSPVWRMTVYQTRLVTGDPVKNIAGPDKDPDDLDNQNVPSTIDRSIYFAGFDPESRNPTWDNDGVAFYNDLPNNNVPSVRPGRYLVVGAGKSMGAGEYLAEFGAETGSRTSTRGIMLNTLNSTNASNAVAMHGANATTVMDPAGFPVESPADSALPQIPGDNRPSVADVAIINQPRRFSISEPAGGYPIDWAGSRWDGTQYAPKYIDIPLDDQRAMTSAGGGIGAGGNGGRGGIGAPPNRKPTTSLFLDGETRLSLPGQSPGGGAIGGAGAGAPTDAAQARRTIPGFSWIYLQRLANPLLPWNPPAGKPGHRANDPINPYMTVDSMGANVTVFNGLRDMEELTTDPEQRPLRFRNNFAIDTFSSVQRGRVNLPTDPALRLPDLQSRAVSGRQRRGPTDPDTAPQANQPAQNLWNPEGIGITSNTVAGYFKNKAGNGFGAEGNPPIDSHNFNGIPDHTLGFLNEPFRNPNPATPDPIRDRVVPGQPFPWIDWNNRPFANPGELMQVPMRRSSQLLQTFSFLNSSSTEKYDGTVPEIALSNTMKFNLDGPYGHLPNFFRTKVDTQNRSISGLYRVLDLVEVPSRYVGTETWLNPAVYGQTLADDPIAGPPNKSTRDPIFGWQPPFNRLPERREPGKVNINTTMFTEDGKPVWDGVMHGSAKRAGNNDSSHPGPDGDALISIRRGYGTLGDKAGQLDAAYPTLVANPFRPGGTADMVPLTNMIREGTESTLMRSMGNPPFANGSAIPQTQPQGLPFLTADTAEGYRNANRNPYFRYSPISRLSSMTTTRSNVFAVWITVGFFEVEEAPPWTGSYANGTPVQTVHPTIDTYSRAYPDGYQFTKEAGSDTGQEVRVRKFAIVDRTIPVGFQPGANHNVKETIRLKREIE